MTGILTAVLLFTGVLAGCAAPQQDSRQPAPGLAFKGIEIYSWRSAAGEWRYSLLSGTNRRKLKSEILASPLTQEQLESEVARLPENETLLWSNEVGDDDTDKSVTLEFPPQETIEKLRELARRKGVKLWTSLDPEE